jgi:hypothetical protein
MNRQCLICAILGALLVGCVADKHPDFTPLQNGFGSVARPKGYPDSSLTEGLSYRDADGKTALVWPYLQPAFGDNVQITSNLAVLVGGIASIEPDGQERLCDRLLAFEAPGGPPLEITDQIYRQYCARTGVAFADIMTNSFHSITQTNDSLLFKFSIRETDPTLNPAFWRGTTFTISWQDIDAIIQDVKKNGKAKKEQRSGAEYLKLDWHPAAN